MNPRLDHDKGDDELVVPAFDPAKTMRGVFAHRQGEQPEDELRVAEFWQKQGWTAEFLEHNPRGMSSRLPDLRLSRDGRPFAYCEVKTVRRHTSNIRILRENRPVEERIEVSSSGVEERLTTDIVTAIRQLLHANPDHGLLNIVVLVNRDADASAPQLAHILNRRPSIKELASQDWRVMRTYEEVERFRVGVDICLWVDCLEGAGFSLSAYFLLNPSLAPEVGTWTGLDQDKQILLQPAA